MGQPRGSRIRRPLLTLLGGLALLVVALKLLEIAFPSESPADKPDLPPIRPTLERVNDREILIDAGLIDRLSFRFGDEESVEEVDGIYRCLERRLEDDFGTQSAPQGDNRWSRRLEVGRRLRGIRDDCLDRPVDDPADGT